MPEPRPELLASEGIEALRQDAKEKGAYLREAWRHLRRGEMLTPSEQAPLRQHTKKLYGFAYKAFERLRSKPRGG
jgi:hypothetical protein